MIKHIVCWKIKENAEGRLKSENVAIMKEKLLCLRDKIGEITQLEIGTNSKNADPANFDIVLITTFANMRDLDIYQKHAEHKKVAEFIGNIKEYRACIDYEF
jgi:hypothetical protein